MTIYLRIGIGVVSPCGAADVAAIKANARICKKSTENAVLVEIFACRSFYEVRRNFVKFFVLIVDILENFCAHTV